LKDKTSDRTQELIRNIKDYDPSKPNNAQLADDMRICFAWYSSLCEGKKLKFTKEEVVNLARKIYQEIERRKREGRMKHEWKPEQMKPHSHELFKIITASPHLSMDLQSDDSESESEEQMLDFKVEFVEERKVGKFTSKIFRYVTPEGYEIDNAFYIRVEDQEGNLIHEVDQPPGHDVIFRKLQTIIPPPPGAISDTPSLISPKNPFWHFTITPDEPVLCYQVFSEDDYLIHLIDAYTGEEIGTGTPPPHNSLVFAGCHEYGGIPHDVWRRWWRNAAMWFSSFGSPPFSQYMPTTEEYLNFLKSPVYGSFLYEFGHGSSVSWYNGHDWVYASSINAQLQSRKSSDPAFNFVFLGHCGALVDTGEGSFAHAFAQGRTSGFAVVGYYNMHEYPDAWSHSRSWQNSLFAALADRLSAGDAFDIACAAFPSVIPAVRIFGDRDYVPVPSADFTTLEGYVSIESPPPEASIFINDLDSGYKTPATVPIPIPVDKLRTTHKVKVTLKHRFFYDKIRSAYVRPNFTYYLSLKMRPSVRISAKTIRNDYSVTFEFSLISKATSEVIREPSTFKLVNLSTRKELTATTNESGVASFSIPFNSTFFVPGKQKLICTLEGSGELIRKFRRITISSEKWLSSSESDIEDLEDWSDNEEENSASSLALPSSSIMTELEGTLPIYPGNVSPHFEPLNLDDFLEKWNSFYLRKPFILLVGSLANWRHTTGDIDILVKARDPTPLLTALDRAIIKCYKLGEDQLADLLIQVQQFVHSDSLFLLTRWRIERAFPNWKGRIQVLDDSFSGPFTNFVELADLAAVARSEKVRQEMAQRAIKLFQWFPMLKPMHGRQKGEIYSVDSVIEVLKTRKDNWFDIGIYIQKKYDGTHCQVHKSGDKVFIITEDGTDVTRNCPTLVKEFQQQPGNFVVCGEIELWKNGKHQPRAVTAGILNASKPQPDEKDLIFNVYDCLYWEPAK